MKNANYFRATARQALGGKWLIAVIVGLAASLLGAGAGGGFNINFDVSKLRANVGFARHRIFSAGIGDGINFDIAALVAGVFSIIAFLALIIGVLYFILGSFIGVGYAKFNLNLADGTNGAFETLFTYFSYWKTTAVMRLLKGLYVFLWSLLLVIPGIVAAYSYSMTEYILAENPNMSATEAIASSKQMMYGNRCRLFCLQFSFIGWDILASLSLGIGYLWLTPYRQAAFAAFYREISSTQPPFEAYAWERA